MRMKNIIQEKSFAFALDIIGLSKFMQKEKKEFVMSKQVLRSGTAIGALVREAEHAESKADFIHKMNIALKEANETDYWIELLHQSNEIKNEMYHSIQPKIEEIIKLLVSIVKTSKMKYKKWPILNYQLSIINFKFSIINFPFNHNPWILHYIKP